MLRFIALAASATVFASANPLAHFTTEELVGLAEEVADWKASAAGKQAAALNVMPMTLSYEDELVRFQKTKTEVEEQRKLNPDAQFGTDHPFALMTTEEFSTWVKRSGINDKTVIFSNAEKVTFDEPPTIMEKDHTNGNCVGPVQDQGNCGSCWAFAATGAIESAQCLATGNFVKLGEQRLVSCCKANNSDGCKGGWPGHAIDWVQSNGICKQSDNPYTSGSGTTGSCSGANQSCQKVSLSVGGNQRTSGDNGLANALSKQPTSVVVAAGNSTWKNYKGGVVNQCAADAKADHAVVSTAYTSSQFTIKNSWGTTWGSNGYMNLKRVRSQDGVCFVTSSVSYPSVTVNPNPGPGPNPRPSPGPGPNPGGCACSSGNCNNGVCRSCLSGSYCIDGWNQRNCEFYGMKWCGGGGPNPGPTPRPSPGPAPGPTPAPTDSDKCSCNAGDCNGGVCKMCLEVSGSTRRCFRKMWKDCREGGDTDCNP